MLGAENADAYHGDVTRIERDEDLHRRALLLHIGPGPVAAWWVEVSNPHDLDANALHWSDEVYRVFGYEPGEVQVSNALFFDHVHPEDRERVKGAVREAIAERRPYSIEHRIVRRDGSEGTVLERGEARFDWAGNLVALYGTVQYVTAEVRALEALRLSEERARRQLAELEALYATAPVGLCVFDRELRWVRLNQLIASINGVPLEAHIGRTPREIVPDVGEQAEAALKKILETGEPLEFEMSGTTAAQPGVQRFWDERWAPIRKPDGQIIGITVAAEETTARKRAEQRIERLAQFVENNPNPVIRLSRDLTVLYANTAAAQSALGVGTGTTAPQYIVEVVTRAIREKRRVRSEAKVGRSYFSLAVVAFDDGEANVYAQDVTALRKAEKRLRHVNKRKDEFMATLSHELRNPLASLLNAAQVLEHAAPSSEVATRARAVCKRQAEHLARLVDDLLDVTRIAKGKIELERSRIDLRQVLLRVADDLRILFTREGIRFTTLADQSLWVDGDTTRLEQAIGNLLHNAAKFTSRGGEVTLSLEAHGDRAEVHVRDTGAGIEPAVLPHVFEKYVQGGWTRGMSKGGLGLGLPLVKGIAELHGGEAHARSAGKNQGAELVVTLPLAAAPAVPGERIVPEHVGARQRVVVIEDNVDCAQMLADLLSLLGHEVEIANDGRNGIELVRTHYPNVVLCDIGLPDMSGYDVARAVRATSAVATRLVALTGLAQAEDAALALEAGFDAHVPKPCSLDDLRRVVRPPPAQL